MTQWVLAVKSYLELIFILKKTGECEYDYDYDNDKDYDVPGDLFEQEYE